MAWTVHNLSDGSSAVVPDDDVTEHSRDQHCICRPVWRLLRDPGSGASSWAFIHTAMDGRKPVEIVERYS